jgi:hypothetical protein
MCLLDPGVLYKMERFQGRETYCHEVSQDGTNVISQLYNYKRSRLAVISASLLILLCLWLFPTEKQVHIRLLEGQIAMKTRECLGVIVPCIFPAGAASIALSWSC